MSVLWHYLRKHLLLSFVACIGFLSALVTLFVDVKSPVSIKYLLLSFLIFLTLVVSLVQIIFDLLNKKSLIVSTKVIRISPKDGNMIIRSSLTDLVINSVVSIYYEDGEIEKLYAVGFVENKQENGVVLIRITRCFDRVVEIQSHIQNIKIKTTIPYTAFEEESHG